MAGLQIAISDFPEMHKLAVDEDLGVVFNPENQKDIVKSINKLLIPNIYKKQNIMKARKKCCWENEEKKLFAIYQTLKGGNK